MKILLVAINAKYIHSNLAVYSLRAYAQTFGDIKAEIELAEYTINQLEDDILQDIYRRNPDILCISCYIWNILYAHQIITEIKKVRPDLHIWLGGPEVSYDSRAVLTRFPEVAGVIKGEGEKTFAELCHAYLQTAEKGQQRFTPQIFSHIAGISYRSEQGEIVENPWRPVMDLSEVPFVYQDMKVFEHKIIYYESSRGCPFSCSYCLSSVDKKLRFRELSLVKKELDFFLEHKVKQVKFVDRTFNCSRTHAQAVWKHIASHDNGVTNFHFEVAADLMDEESLKLIRTMRPGLIQLEIGVQSTNPDTIREIKRTMKFETVKKVVNEIKSMGNIHQHLDLIAGLPLEDIGSFASSFNDVYGLGPEQLQLGFLKVLKGSYMEEKAEEYQLVYKGRPPYEVLGTKWLSYEDILTLKGIEAVVEIYYNSGQFTMTMKQLEQEFQSPYQMYQRLSAYNEMHTTAGAQHKRSTRYEILLGFAASEIPEKEAVYRELLIWDYYLRENAKSRPEFAGPETVEKTFLKEFYENDAAATEFLAGYEAYDKNQRRKMTHIEKFKHLQKTVLFDYLHRNPLNQEAQTFIIE